jgi:hypothetical protein
VRALIVLLGIVALLASGCGGGGSSSGTTSGGGPATTAPTTPLLSETAYQAKLKKISTEIGNRLGNTSTSGKIPKADVGKLAAAFHTFSDRLAELNPPAAVKQLHARLIKAMDDLGVEFPHIASSLNKSGKDPSAAITALFGAHAIQELIQIGDDFKKQGYNLNLNP